MMKLPDLRAPATLLAGGAAIVVVGSYLYTLLVSRDSGAPAPAACGAGARVLPRDAAAAAATLARSLAADPIALACASEALSAEAREAACARLCRALLRAVAPSSQGFVVLGAAAEAVSVWVPPGGALRSAPLRWFGMGAVLGLTGFARRDRPALVARAVEARRSALINAQSAPRGYWYLAVCGARAGHGLDATLQPVFTAVRAAAWLMRAALRHWRRPPPSSYLSSSPLTLPRLSARACGAGGQGRPSVLHRDVGCGKAARARGRGL
jgi:hypothetical protein